jgi:hypothetical protein
MRDIICLISGVISLFVQLQDKIKNGPSKNQAIDAEINNYDVRCDVAVNYHRNLCKLPFPQTHSAKFPVPSRRRAVFARCGENLLTQVKY